MKRPNITPKEDAECITFVHYLELLQSQGQDILFTHIANETFTKSIKQKHRNRVMGVRQGLLDYVLIINKRLIFIEMKRKEGGRLTDTQRMWRNKLMAAGVEAYVALGFDEAKKIVEVYLK